MKDIRKYQPEQWRRERSLVQRRLDAIRDNRLANLMADVKRRSIRLNCPHQITRIVRTIDVEVNGTVIDGERCRRCVFCNATVEFVS